MERILYAIVCWTLFIDPTSAQISPGIRLVGGSNGCRGRLEIMAELESNTSQYYPACSNVASDNEAKVICRIIDCPSEQARRVSLNNFDLPDSTDSPIPFAYVCSGNELDLNSCYQSNGKVCERTINSTRSNIAIECDIRKDVNALLIAIVSVIVVTFIAVPVVTYSCIKCFEWIDNR